jgi:sugar phosphate isomerase/epimerase
MNRRDFLAAVPVGALGCATARVQQAHRGQAPAVPAKPRKAQLRSALCAYSYKNEFTNKTVTYEDLIRFTVDAGADGIDCTVYWFPSQSDDFVIPLRRWATRNAVELYSLSLRAHMIKNTQAIRDEQVALVASWVPVAVKLGAGHMRVFGGSIPEGASLKEAIAWGVESLKRAADHAGKAGIILGLENGHGITEDAESMLEILRRVDSPWVGINLDCGNFPKDGWRNFELCVPHAVNVQVKTEMYDAEGKPEPTDWARLMRTLSAGGYRGYVALEHEGKPGQGPGTPELLRMLHTLVRNAG